MMLLIGEPETLSYDELQRSLSRQLHGEEWKTFRIPKPFAKFGAWLQGFLPGPSPFIKPWMIESGGRPLRARSLARPQTARLGAAPFSARGLAEDDHRQKTDPPGWEPRKTSWRRRPLHRIVPAWPHVANMLLGLWLIGTAPALDVVMPALLWSDMASGAAAISFSALALIHTWAAWAVCGVGLWVMSAPLKPCVQISGRSSSRWPRHETASAHIKAIRSYLAMVISLLRSAFAAQFGGLQCTRSPQSLGRRIELRHPVFNANPATDCRKPPRDSRIATVWPILASFRGCGERVRLQTPELCRERRPEELITIARYERIALMCAEAVSWRGHCDDLVRNLHTMGFNCWSITHSSP